MHLYPELRSASDGLKICFMQSEAVYHPYFKRMNKTKAYKIQWFCHFFNLNKVQPLLGNKVPNDCTRNNRY